MEPSDSEIHAQAYAEWVSTLMPLWDSVGKEVDNKRLKLYVKQFDNVPLGLMEKAVKRAIRDNGNYQVVPTIGALWHAIKKELDDPVSVDDAIEHWIDRSWSRVVFMGWQNV